MDAAGGSTQFADESIGRVAGSKVAELSRWSRVLMSLAAQGWLGYPEFSQVKSSAGHGREQTGDKQSEQTRFNT